MAGHVHTVDTGKARRTASGRRRKIRERIPTDEAETSKRSKRHEGARTITMDRISRTTDPLRRLDAAREYVRSAAAKYLVDPEMVSAAVEALLAAGDQIFTEGEPLSPSARRTRRDQAEYHRARRQRTELLVREGAAAVRRQQTEAGGQVS